MDKLSSFSKKKDLDSTDIMNLLNELNNEMSEKGKSAEICLVGGAVMCLCYNSRPSTLDIDAVFEPKMEMYDSIKNIARKNNIQEDWLNDGVKGFLGSKSEFKLYTELSNLKIFVASASYMLAMKILSSRVDSTNDRGDIITLLKTLGIYKYEDVEREVLKFYPESLFQSKCRYFVMEILEEL